MEVTHRETYVLALSVSPSHYFLRVKISPRFSQSCSDNVVSVLAMAQRSSTARTVSITHKTRTKEEESMHSHTRLHRSPVAVETAETLVPEVPHLTTRELKSTMLSEKRCTSRRTHQVGCTCRHKHRVTPQNIPKKKRYQKKVEEINR